MTNVIEERGGITILEKGKTVPQIKYAKKAAKKYQNFFIC